MIPALALLNTSRRLICDPCSSTAEYIKEAHVIPALALLNTRRLMCDPHSSTAEYIKEAHM